MSLKYLSDLWDDGVARTLDPPALLRYRSNLLGADLRITNFGGGNTSSKIEGPDPLTASRHGSCGKRQRGGYGHDHRIRALPLLVSRNVLEL